MLTNRSTPGCAVVPEVTYPDVDAAIDWLCAAFGFTLRLQIGNHRAQMNVGDGAIVITAWSGKEVRQRCAIMVRVEDVDAHHRRASQRGAVVLAAPADFAYGERQYTVEDFAGHRWTFSQSIADVDPRDWGGATRD
jgi:uncharacterized glyoxalase superfamily protein PhnB